KNLVQVVVVDGTIPYEIIGRYGASKVFLKPASEGTGVIAGGAIKIVIESAGIRNILTKCLGSHNPHNIVKATLSALKQLKKPEEIRKRLGVAE
ncbi:MAG: 30S ribosomal protein S5, partial [Deltaproteobacteria bacterium]|nr:30S ribosomal protein S5 [Deltaproteobacteria bacterium]